MDRQLIREVTSLGDLDRIDLADQVGDGDIRRGQLLAVAVFACEPGDRSVIALLGDDVAAGCGDRVEWILGDLAAGEDRRLLIEQATSARMIRDLAWPRSPRKMMSCPASIAFSIGG